MKKNNHRSHQIKYFSEEFSLIKTYRLDPWQKTYIARIKNTLLDKSYKNKTLIDIATGSGYVAVEMAKLGINVIACDLTEQAIKNLENYKKLYKLSNLKLLVCPAEKIPLKDKRVDYLVANAILEHIPKEKKAINEWKRILKPNGRIFITVPLKLRYVWFFFWLLNYIHDKRIGHLRRYDLNDLAKRFNMKIKKVYYTGHFIKTIWAIISMFYKSKKLDIASEKNDTKFSNKRYGANNIIVVLEM